MAESGTDACTVLQIEGRSRTIHEMKGEPVDELGAEIMEMEIMELHSKVQQPPSAWVVKVSVRAEEYPGDTRRELCLCLAKPTHLNLVPLKTHRPKPGKSTASSIIMIAIQHQRPRKKEAQA